MVLKIDLMKLIPSNIKSITVIKLDHIGDVILATPVIESLRIGFAEAKIRVVVGSWSKEVLYRNPNVDEVICYDPPWLDRSLGVKLSDKKEENRKSIKKLLDSRSDLVVDLRRNDFNHIAFSSLFSYEYFLAYKTGSQFDHLITHGVSVSSKLHVTDQQIKLLKCLGLQSSKEPQLYPSFKDEQWAENQLSSKRPRIAVFTGAGAPIKKWPLENFTKLVFRLQKIGLEIVLVGGVQEELFARKINNRVKVNNLCGKTSLAQLCSILKRVTLLISNDSAPVHVASAVGTPVVVITKPNVRVEFSPIGNDSIAVSRKICKWKYNCPGFIFNAQSSKPKLCKCINSVSVEEVEKVVYKKILSSNL